MQVKPDRISDETGPVYSLSFYFCEQYECRVVKQ